LACPCFSQGKREPLSIEKAQKQIDETITGGMKLRVTEVFSTQYPTRNRDYPTGYAWCDVIRDDQYVGSTVVPFRGDTPEDNVWSLAFNDALPMESDEKARLLPALRRLVDIWFDIERGADRLDQILPDNIADFTDDDGNLFGFFRREYVKEHSSDEVRQKLRIALDALPVIAMALVGGKLSEDEAERLENVFTRLDEQGQEELDEKFRASVKIISQKRSELLALDRERLKQLKTLVSTIVIHQIHKDENEVDGALKIRGLPRVVYHMGRDEVFGAVLTWFGDDLKIVRIMVD
jgi:hypothetical protein